METNVFKSHTYTHMVVVAVIQLEAIKCIYFVKLKTNRFLKVVFKTNTIIILNATVTAALKIQKHKLKIIKMFDMLEILMSCKCSINYLFFAY